MTSGSYNTSTRFCATLDTLQQNSREYIIQVHVDVQIHTSCHTY